MNLSTEFTLEAPADEIGPEIPPKYICDLSVLSL
jgi:hypothetical protein